MLAATFTIRAPGGANPRGPAGTLPDKKRAFPRRHAKQKVCLGPVRFAGPQVAAGSAVLPIPGTHHFRLRPRSTLYYLHGERLEIPQGRMQQR